MSHARVIAGRRLHPPVRPEAFRTFAVLIVAAGAGAFVAMVPSIGFQLAVVIGAAISLLALVMASRGTVLDPAFVLAGGLYLIGPVGTVIRQAGLGLSTLALLAAIGAVFVTAALVTFPSAIRRLYVLAPLAALVALGFASVAWSTHPEYGLDKLAVWILAGVLPAAFIVILASARGGVQWGVVLAAALAVAAALLLFGGSSPEYPGRISLFGDNPIWMARAMFVGALVALFGNFPRIVKLMAVPILVAAGLVTVSLGPLLGLLAGAWAGWIASLLQHRGRDARQTGWVTMGLLSGVVLLVVLTDAVVGGERSILATMVLSDPNVIGRAVLLDTAVGLFLGAPVQGIGLGGFASLGFLEYPHNLVIEVAAELGMVGLVLLGLWAALAFRGALGSPLLVALLVATCVFALFSGSLASNAEFWMVSALAASGFATAGRNPDQVPHGHRATTSLAVSRAGTVH